MKKTLSVIGIITFMSTIIFLLCKIYDEISKLHNDFLDYEDNIIGIKRGKTEIVHHNHTEDSGSK